VGTSVPTLCSSRAEYRAHRAGRTREMPFNLLPARFARLYAPALNAISGRIPRSSHEDRHFSGQHVLIEA
jgi:hypothetical protein